MALETVTHIADLVVTNPTASDPKSQGDDHIRNIKTALVHDFAGFTGAVCVTGTDGGSANAYTLTPTNALVAYGTKMAAVFAPTADNTGASTLNISGLGTKNIKRIDGTALAAGDLASGSVYVAIYNGTEFRLLSPTKQYIDQLAFGTALPAQIVGLLISDGTNASFSKTLTGFAMNEVKGADVVCASTIDLSTTTGNLVHVTGSTGPVTAITLASGAERTVVWDSTPTINHNATTLILPGGQNITVAAGDVWKMRGDGSGNTRVVNITKASGASIGQRIPYGFTLSNNSGTPNSVLDIAAGFALDSTSAFSITGTAFSKSTAGSWTAGTGNNGMGQGLTIANSTLYHVFAIINSGAFDVYFDTSVSAANKPTNTTAFRRIGSFLTNGSAQIIAFHQYGQYIYWDAQVTDLNGTPPSSATLLALTIPSGVNVRPIFSVLHQDGSVGNGVQFWSPITGSTAKNQLAIQVDVASTPIFGNCDSILSNTSKQIYYKTNGANSPTTIVYTIGWIDPSLAPIV